MYMYNVLCPPYLVKPLFLRKKVAQRWAPFGPPLRFYRAIDAPGFAPARKAAEERYAYLCATGYVVTA